MIRTLSGPAKSGKSWDALVLTVDAVQRAGAALYISLDATTFWIEERLVHISGSASFLGLTVLSGQERALDVSGIIFDWMKENERGLVVIDPCPYVGKDLSGDLERLFEDSRDYDLLIVRNEKKR
jgi:hypothetical protein